jgi:hypothetical protein
MLRQSDLGLSGRKTDLFVHLYRQTASHSASFPEITQSPIELAKKVCGEGGMSACPVYPRRHEDFSLFEHLSPASLVRVLHLGTQRHGALLAHILSTVLDDFSVSTRRGVGLLVNYTASHVRR